MSGTSQHGLLQGRLTKELLSKTMQELIGKIYCNQQVKGLLQNVAFHLHRINANDRLINRLR